MNKKVLAFQKEFSNLSLQPSNLAKAHEHSTHSNVCFNQYQPSHYPNNSLEYFASSPQKINLNRLWPEKSQQRKISNSTLFNSQTFQLKEFSDKLLSSKKKNDFQVFQKKQVEKQIENKRKYVFEEGNTQQNIVSLNNQISDFESKWQKLTFKQSQQTQYQIVSSELMNKMYQLEKPLGQRSPSQQTVNNSLRAGANQQNQIIKHSFLQHQGNIVANKLQTRNQQSNIKCSSAMENLRDWQNFNFLKHNEDEQPALRQPLQNNKPVSINSENNMMQNQQMQTTKSFIDNLFQSNRQNEIEKPKSTYLMGFEEKLSTIQVPQKSTNIQFQEEKVKYQEKSQEQTAKTPFDNKLFLDKQSQKPVKQSQVKQSQLNESLNEPNQQSPIQEIKNSNNEYQEESPIKGCDSPNLQKIKQLQEKIDKISNYQEKKEVMKKQIQEKALEIKQLSQNSKDIYENQNYESPKKEQQQQKEKEIIEQTVNYESPLKEQQQQQKLEFNENQDQESSQKEQQQQKELEINENQDQESSQKEQQQQKEREINEQAVNLLDKNMEQISTELKKNVFDQIKSINLPTKKNVEQISPEFKQNVFDQIKSINLPTKKNTVLPIRKLNQSQVKGSTKIFFKLFAKYNSMMFECFQTILTTNFSFFYQLFLLILENKMQDQFSDKKFIDAELIYQRILETNQSPPKKDQSESPQFEQSDIKPESPIQLPIIKEVKQKEEEKYAYNIKNNLNPINFEITENELQMSDLVVKDSQNFANIQEKFKTYYAEENSVPYTMPNIQSKGGPTNFQNYVESHKPQQMQRREHQAKTTKESESKLKNIVKGQSPLQATLKQLIQQQKQQIGNTFKQLTDASISFDKLNQSGSPAYKKSKTQYQ